MLEHMFLSTDNTQVIHLPVCKIYSIACKNIKIIQLLTDKNESEKLFSELRLWIVLETLINSEKIIRGLLSWSRLIILKKADRTQT